MARIPKPRRPATRLEDLLLSSPGDRRVRTSHLRIAPGPTPVRVPQDAEGSPSRLPGRTHIYLETREVEGWDPPYPVIYVGAAGVDKEHGYPIGPRESLVLDAPEGLELFAIQDSTSPQADLWVAEIAWTRPRRSR